MVVVSYSGKEINAKLVYYGAGLSGKTTNLEAIYEAVPDTSRGKMVSMKTQSDRTLFFDLLPLDLGEIMGFKTRFLLYTVPGQVFYNATRKLVLKGADALVFVADSEVGKMEENKESLVNLRTNLAEYNINLDTVPWVIQYNKRDLPNVYTVEELNAELNPGGKAPFFEAVARDGKGVFETFRGISHLLMEKVTKDLRRSPGSNRPAPTPEPEATPTPREQVRASAPPSAPVQHIQHEAVATPAPIASGNETRIDYGREIELPGFAPMTQIVPDAQPAPVSVGAGIGTGPAPFAPAVSGSSPSSARIASPLAPSAPVFEEPAAASPLPFAPPQPVVSAAPDPVPAANGQAQSEHVKQVVVPVKLPAGGTYEIVIKVQIDTHA